MDITGKHEKGIQKLFFIARDGYILKKIADILIEKYRYPIATVYLYGSRKAWRLPSIKPKDLICKSFSAGIIPDKFIPIKDLRKFWD